MNHNNNICSILSLLELRDRLDSDGLLLQYSIYKTTQPQLISDGIFIS